jgi:hypothetical protein
MQTIQCCSHIEATTALKPSAEHNPRVVPTNCTNTTYQTNWTPFHSVVLVLLLVFHVTARDFLAKILYRYSFFSASDLKYGGARASMTRKHSNRRTDRARPNGRTMPPAQLSNVLTVKIMSLRWPTVVPEMTGYGINDENSIPDRHQRCSAFQHSIRI